MPNSATAFTAAPGLCVPTRAPLTRRRPRTDTTCSPSHRQLTAAASRRTSRSKEPSPLSSDFRLNKNSNHNNGNGKKEFRSVPPLGPSTLDSEESYIQCPQCFALYHVEADELEGSPRVVACSACLHEWYASGDTLLWGDQSGLDALEAVPAVDASKENTEKAITAARGVVAPSGNSLTTQTDPIESKEIVSDSVEEISLEAEKTVKGDNSTKSTDKNTTTSKEYDEMDSPRTEKNGSSDEHSQVTKQNNSNEKSASNTRKAAAISAKDASSVGNTGEEGENADGEEGESRFSIFVGNLSFRATEEDLYRAFAGFGAVLSCLVPSDPSGASKGYGFVEMQSRRSGMKAIESLQGASICGRDVSLNVARPRSDRKAPQGAPRDPRKRRKQGGGPDERRNANPGSPSSTSTYVPNQPGTRREAKGRGKSRR